MPRVTRSTRAAPAAAAAPKPASKKRTSAKAAGASGRALKKQKYDSSPPDKTAESTTIESKYFKKGESAKPKKGRKKRAAKQEEDYEDDPDAVSPDADHNSSDADSDFWGLQEQSTGGKNALSRAIKDFSRKRGPKSEASVASEPPTTSSKKDLWREGVKTGLGPGKEVFIKKPKARDAGDTPYEDETLHPNTLLFLEDLAENNERQWLKAHDADYRTSKKDWETFVESLTEKITEQDGTIPELPAKDLVFRIHRDIRFSKDPTPYKTHFSAAWSRTGKKGPYAAYYVHCQPGASFIGAGLWHPEADKLALLRDDIDNNSKRLKDVLRQEGLRREFFGGIPDDEDEAVGAFAKQNSESALKTKPKRVTNFETGDAVTSHGRVRSSGVADRRARPCCWFRSTRSYIINEGYEHDNENIELLRLRSFTIGKPVSDADLLSPDAQEKIATLIGIMEPFVTYLNSVVMPDPGGPDTSSIATDSADEE